MRRAAIALLMIWATVGILLGAVSGGLVAGDQMWPLTWLGWAPVGFIILWQRPGNRVGQTMMGVGLAWGVSFGFLALSHVLDGQAAVWAELINVLFGVVPWLGVIALLLIFPTGRPETPLEQISLGATGLFGVAVLAGFAVASAPMEETGVSSPLAVPELSGIAAAITGDESFLLVLALVLAAVLGIVLRWRRSNGPERAQYQWLLLGASAFGVVTAIGQVLPEGSSGELVWWLGGVSIPTAIGIAILRYRLYDIDRMVSRTISYAVVLGLLAAVFFGVVTAVGSLFQSESDLAIAASTLAVAALFNPVRKRVQGWVDRRFNRSRYDAQRVMDRFAGSLQDRVDSDEVVQGWVGVVSETMQPASVAVWMRER